MTLSSFKKLSILIPTVIGREQELSKIYNFVDNFHYARMHSFSECNGCRITTSDGIQSPIQIISASDNKEMTIGEKRELLYSLAEGEYSIQVDDDDMLSKDAIELILAALEQKTDCITYREQCWINGILFKSNHSLIYDDWADNVGEFDFVRTPFMKSVIKTEIARSVPIPHIRFGEDHEWAKALKPHLRNEVHIDKELYIYQHNSKPEDFNSRYGII